MTIIFNLISFFFNIQFLQSGLDSIESDFLFCQNSCSSVNHIQSCQRISSEVQNVEEKTFKYLSEWDDSGDEDIIKGAEPKTKFEAALRRAEEKNKKRMVCL